MTGDEWELTKTIARAYRESGIAAKSHGGRLFVESEEGWQGPIEPDSVRKTYLDDIKLIEGHARAAASRVIENLDEGSRNLLGEGSGYLPLFLSEPGRFKKLGYDERRVRIYISIIRYMSIFEEFR